MLHCNRRKCHLFFFFLPSHICSYVRALPSISSNHFKNWRGCSFTKTGVSASVSGASSDKPRLLFIGFVFFTFSKTMSQFSRVINCTTFLILSCVATQGITSISLAEMGSLVAATIFATLSITLIRIFQHTLNLSVALVLLWLSKTLQWLNLLPEQFIFLKELFSVKVAWGCCLASSWNSCSTSCRLYLSTFQHMFLSRDSFKFLNSFLDSYLNSCSCFERSLLISNDSSNEQVCQTLWRWWQQR